jgi:hypothetical protein
MRPTLELLDGYYSSEEVPLPERSIKALREMLEFGFVEVTCLPREKVERWTEYMDTPWFRALFLGVEEWYRDQYGAEALAARGNLPLRGVILLRGSPFSLRVPIHRKKIESPSKTAWMYMEAGIGEGENPQEWIVQRPNLERFSEAQRLDADADLHHVASSLRAIQHHLLGAAYDDDEQRGLRASTRSYIERAANRITAQTVEEFAFAWMDLQMSAEAALKLVIHRGSGSYPRTHSLDRLLISAQSFGVFFDEQWLATWPSFKVISNRRYGTDYMAGLAELYCAYKLILDLIVACVRTVDPPVPSGAGILLHVAPWLIDNPCLPHRSAEIPMKCD